MQRHLVLLASTALAALALAGPAAADDRFRLELEGGAAWQLRNDFAVPGTTGTRLSIDEANGGPFAAYGPHFAPEIQLYAAQSYVVLYVNPRGSTSYGADFANLREHRFTKVEQLLNDRPRKRLGYRTPNEILASGLQPKDCD